MALLRMKQVNEMNDKARAEKLKDLKMELARSQVSANKANSRTKEIKRAIARILTFTSKTEVKNK